MSGQGIFNTRSTWLIARSKTHQGTIQPIRRREDVSLEPCLKRTKKDKPNLKPEQLFAGRQEHVWEMLLSPVLESYPLSERFTRPSRLNNIVPVRELTFQALKPNAPGRYRHRLWAESNMYRPSPTLKTCHPFLACTCWHSIWCWNPQSIPGSNPPLE